MPTPKFAENMRILAQRLRAIADKGILVRSCQCIGFTSIYPDLLISGRIHCIVDVPSTALAVPLCMPGSPPGCGRSVSVRLVFPFFSDRVSQWPRAILSCVALCESRLRRACGSIF